MPSQVEVHDLSMASGAKSEYTGKQPETVILALKGCARMSWQEVATKYSTTVPRGLSCSMVLMEPGPNIGPCPRKPP